MVCFFYSLHGDLQIWIINGKSQAGEGQSPLLDIILFCFFYKLFGGCRCTCKLGEEQVIYVFRNVVSSISLSFDDDLNLNCF